MAVNAKARCVYIEENMHTGILSVRLIPVETALIQGQLSLQINKGENQFQVGTVYDVTITKSNPQKEK